MAKAKKLPFEWPTGKERVLAPAEAHVMAGIRTLAMSIVGYADAYRRAAETLYRSRRSRGGTDNLLLFPLGFLWRHHVELSLKGITSVMPGSDGSNPDDFRDHHNLLELWRPIERYARKRQPNDKAIRHATQIMEKLNHVDPDGYGFRYPVMTAKKGRKRFLGAAPEVVDLDEFQRSMLALANLLEGMWSMFMAERNAMPSEGDW